MTTKDIRTSHSYTACDVCGRTLLRGERAETYINGGARRSVCELCKTRALHEGWVREGTLPDYGGGESSNERRRSLLGRLRSRREATHDRGDGQPASGGFEIAPPATPAAAPPPRAAPRATPRSAPREPREPREPRHIRAVPSSDEQKIIAAVDLFNQSEHRRTVSGVARSLGAPVVSVAPAVERPSLVHIVVSWELCWYRYEVDLSDELPTVRVDGQGYELEELSERERLPNAVADDVGQLSVP
jgi:hypothetical protein